jgi:hypothetical protein
MHVEALVLELVADDVPSADHLSDGEDTVSLDGLWAEIGNEKITQDRKLMDEQGKQSFQSKHNGQLSSRISLKTHATHADTKSDPTARLQYVPPPTNVRSPSPDV